MYTLGALLLMAVLLGAVIAVVDSVLGLLTLDKPVKKLPIIGAHWGLLISVLMIWLIGYHPASGWIGDDEFKRSWMAIVANGAIVYGMIPVKDAVVSMVNKGLRA